MNIKWYLGYLFSYHKFIFDEFDLSKTPPYEFDKNYKFEKFHMEDVKRMEACLQEMEIKCDFDVPVMLERFEQEHHLYVIKKSEKIIGYYWLATKCFSLPYFAIDIILKNDEIYGYNGYVHKDFRGKNLFNQLKAFALNDLYKKGYRRKVGSHFSWNKAVERTKIKFGLFPVGTLCFGYIFTFRYWFISIKKVRIVNHENVFVFWQKLPLIIHKLTK